MMGRSLGVAAAVPVVARQLLSRRLLLASGTPRRVALRAASPHTAHRAVWAVGVGGLMEVGQCTVWLTFTLMMHRLSASPLCCWGQGPPGSLLPARQRQWLRAGGGLRLGPRPLPLHLWVGWQLGAVVVVVV